MNNNNRNHFGRAYDPLVAQFLSPDPYVQYPENPQSYNRYAYCLNNPMKYTDPSGYFSYEEFANQSLGWGQMAWKSRMNGGCAGGYNRMAEQFLSSVSVMKDIEYKQWVGSWSDEGVFSNRSVPMYVDGDGGHGQGDPPWSAAYTPYATVTVPYRTPVFELTGATIHAGLSFYPPLSGEEKDMAVDPAGQGDNWLITVGGWVWKNVLKDGALEGSADGANQGYQLPQNGSIEVGYSVSAAYGASASLSFAWDARGNHALQFNTSQSFGYSGAGPYLKLNEYNPNYAGFTVDHLAGPFRAWNVDWGFGNYGTGEMMVENGGNIHVSNGGLNSFSIGAERSFGRTFNLIVF